LIALSTLRIVSTSLPCLATWPFTVTNPDSATSQGGSEIGLQRYLRHLESLPRSRYRVSWPDVKFAARVLHFSNCCSSILKMEASSIIRWQHRSKRELPTCTERTSLTKECGRTDGGRGAPQSGKVRRERKSSLTTDRPFHGKPFHQLEGSAVGEKARAYFHIFGCRLVSPFP